MVLSRTSGRTAPRRSIARSRGAAASTCRPTRPGPPRLGAARWKSRGRCLSRRRFRCRGGGLMRATRTCHGQAASCAWRSTRAAQCTARPFAPLSMPSTSGAAVRAGAAPPSWRHRRHRRRKRFAWRGSVRRTESSNHPEQCSCATHVCARVLGADLRATFCLQPMGAPRLPNHPLPPDQLFRHLLSSPPPGDSISRKAVVDTLLLGCIPVFFSTGQQLQWPWHWGTWARRASVVLDADAVASGKLDPVASLRDAHARTAPEMRRVIAEHAQYPDWARTPD